MRQFLSSEIASKTNKYQGRNATRWQSPEYDKLFAQTEVELDPVKRAAMFIALNDMLIKNVVVIPVVTRPGVSAVANYLHAPLSGWDTNTYAIQDWYREV
jgi:peptide/nickel transport system substrate-binding protein